MEAVETVTSDPWGLDRRIASGVEAFLVFLEPLEGEIGGGSFFFAGVMARGRNAEKGESEKGGPGPEGRGGGKVPSMSPKGEAEMEAKGAGWLPKEASNGSPLAKNGQVVRRGQIFGRKGRHGRQGILITREGTERV